ncbi:4-hydroxy-3-methylbut-2-enyl diphosphate reductase [Saccharopolyspora spinosa]|uniref:4-hydroxy-3-methylbut-2-enyl diphosphate reductase n=1 Tax=Saccharopolyspora spinosa TaxID=60894 RepID=UPI001EEF3960|nr:4-hydroxy-3-methylbut-2-enyl diphosphate reductase [Saccharopolyspora spinosa]
MDGVTVANEVRGQGWSQHCPSAPFLLGTLHRSGVTATPARVTADSVQSETAPTQAIAELRADHRLTELFRTAAAAGGPAAYLALAPAETAPDDARLIHSVLSSVEAWGAAAASRTVLLASPRAFCAGVERAITIVERLLAGQEAPIFVRKQIVHNTHVVRDLEERGAVFVDELDEVPVGATAVFSAHGVAPAVREQAQQRQLRVVDATCPLVTKVHSEARRFAERGDTIVFIGHAGHEESEGTLGEAPQQIRLVETEDDIDALEIDGPVSYLTQTTLAVDEANRLVQRLRARFPHLTGPNSDDICYATTNRQDALRTIAAQADLIVVVGSANSSNSVRLVEVAERMGTPAFLIDDVSDVDPRWLADARTIGITAGASAPPQLVSDLLDALAGLGHTTVLERVVAKETLSFGLPTQVRGHAGESVTSTPEHSTQAGGV